ncbi:hypothetical protein KZX46_21685 (plasmid) [Polymorphobacter sp. PAMC 29334]|uniref:hypothetical protein n=1 Tax=Polymorphobacter sp. PAMC 29334 TaxID=2862331 RepID=UPI001C7426A9|nr:hypothetical protein [Polymorphobacter sp. PAMC 29334]QYE37248.1 hypothetical protein KZX46_21685 [Polymorphobacter sp. PAMC 29334]
MSPILLERFDKATDALTVDVLVAFCSTAELDVRALADTVEEEIARALAPDELLVIVRATSFDDAVVAMRSATQGEALIERLAGRCRIELIGYDADAQVTRREALAEGGLKSGVALDEILRRGVTSIFARRGGFVEASESYHFANPSGAHTDRFIRLSNILVRQAEIAFVAVAVMAQVAADARHAYIDTPALYAVVSALNEQWRTLAPERSHLVADNFSSYFGFENHRFTDPARSVAIISASSSGSLGRKLVEHKGFDPKRIVHVLYLGSKKADPGVAVDLGRDETTNPNGYSTERRTFLADDCALCRADSIPITLKGDQFDIAGPQHKPLVITKTDAPKTLEMAMVRLAGSKALRVSAGARLFDIDPAALLASEAYQKRLEYLLRRQVPASVATVVLVDSGARAIVETIAAAIGTLPVPVDRVDLATMAEAPNKRHTGAVLVVASIVGSGRLLLDVSRDLRNLAPDAPIVYLVGFAKVQDPERKRIFNASLVQSGKAVNHVIEYVDELLLPANVARNSWAEELGFLQRNRSSWGASSALLTARLERLRETSRPLLDDLFLPDAKGAALPLREGFVFWPQTLPSRGTHSQADVFLTISSVLQQLRTAPVSSGAQAIRTNWMQQTILSPENFARFNDGIIQASLLRAARPAELDFRDDVVASADAARMIRRIVESAGRPRGEAAAEFLLAIGTGRLRLCPGDTEQVLAEVPDAPDLVAAMVTMCRAERARQATPARSPRQAARSRQRTRAAA